MTLYTSDRFASAAASGTDWRDTAKKVLEELSGARTENDGFNLGFLYISDELIDDAESIMNLFRSVMEIEHWTGCVGLGVCGCGEEFVDAPAIAAMITKIGGDGLCVFPAVDLNQEGAKAVLDPWLDRNEPMLTLVHGDPMGEIDPAYVLAELERMTGGFIAGGMASSRSDHVHFADGVFKSGISGVCFTQDLEVATMISQGCAPLGAEHTITRCEENIIMELDGRRAFDVFTEDLRDMAVGKTGKPTENVKIGNVVPFKGKDDEEEQESNLFRGEVHVAFPVAGSDRMDFLVRHALGIDPDKGWVSVAHNVTNGERMLFVHRDDHTVQSDLSAKLLSLRTRLQAERGTFAPKGALYISCVARTLSDFGRDHGGEMSLVREVIGDVPLAGFYANGEISNRRIYGYSSVLILFL